MYSIEKISNSISNKLTSILNLDADSKSIINYGAFAFIQTAWSIFLIILFGVIFNLLIESLIISFTSSILRKYSGGAHASSPNRCAIIGVIVFGLLSIISVKFTFIPIYLILFVLISFLLTYIIIYRYAPVDHPNKMITKEKTRNRLKKSALNLLHFYLILILILFSFYYELNSSFYLTCISCICLGTLWQSITLINLGKFIISKLDYLLQMIKIY